MASIQARFQGEFVTLAALLDSREARAIHQKELLRGYGQPVVCVLANMPGAVKNNPAARAVVKAGMDALNKALLAQAIPILHLEERPLITGPEGYCVASCPEQALKRLCYDIECAHPWGRLMDLDVIGGSGVPLSRKSLGAPPRTCLVCGGSAADCGRSQAHPLEEVYEKISEILDREE